MDRRSFFEIFGTTALALGLSKNSISAPQNQVEETLGKMGLKIPDASKPVAVYVPYRVSGNQVFIAI